MPQRPTRFQAVYGWATQDDAHPSYMPHKHEAESM